jgi:hypothetical protein
MNKLELFLFKRLKMMFVEHEKRTRLLYKIQEGEKEKSIIRHTTLCVIIIRL